VRDPVKRQTTITLARPSMALSRPKPTSAMEPATIAATTATLPSTQSQPRLVQARSFARRASRNHSPLPTSGRLVSRTASIVVSVTMEA
jgi:hypothetical protein